jgi:predicted ABC-type ATPase
LPTVYFIAGPPGVGKSTSGASFLPDDIEILDPDRIASRYKAQGFSDYKDIGNMKFNDLVKKQLFAGNDFAIELNPGFESHYDFADSIKSFNSDNAIEVILFFTDDIKLCYQRAEQRHLEGGSARKTRAKADASHLSGAIRTAFSKLIGPLPC